MTTSLHTHKIKVCHIIAKMVYGGASIGTLHLTEKLDPYLFECTIIHGVQSENEGNLLQNKVRSYVHFIAIHDMVREIDPIKDLKTFLKLVTLFKKNQYNIVHTHGSKAGVIGRIAAVVARIPNILYTVHGWGLKAGNPIARVLFRFIEKLVASFTTKLLFQTNSDMEEALTHGIGCPKKYVYIGNGINLEPFLNVDTKNVETMRSELRIGNRRVVGTVGRVSTQKNPEGFITIAQKVLEKKDDVIFLFVGGGDQLDLMRKKVSDLNLEDRLIFTGMKENIPEILANFDIFILPSLWEGMPRSLIEAMAMGKAVIVFDIDGIREIVCNRKNGLVVALRDYAAFTRQIISILDNDSVAGKMKLNAIVTASQFDFRKVIYKTQCVYRNLT